MGTLFNQPVRKWLDHNDKDILDFIETIKDISKKTKLSTDQVIEIYKIKELQRKNNLFVTNGDIQDEQLMGFGELFKQLIVNIERISDALQQ